MRHHPVIPPARRYPFGFDAIMANPDHGRFRRWYDATSLLPPGRAARADAPGARSTPHALPEAA
jgi:hypothetical protein